MGWLGGALILFYLDVHIRLGFAGALGVAEADAHEDGQGADGDVPVDEFGLMAVEEHEHQRPESEQVEADVTDEGGPVLGIFDVHIVNS